jgi:pilus assembly protein CpaF
MEIVLTQKGGSTQTLSFEKGEVTIGRVEGNDIVLPRGNVSKRHTRIVIKDGKAVVLDLKSTNGTFVNGKRISGPQVVKANDKIAIGDFQIQVSLNGVPRTSTVNGERRASNSRNELPPPVHGLTVESKEEEEMGEEEVAALPAPKLSRRTNPNADSKVVAYTKLQKDVHDRLIEYLDLRHLDIEKLGDEELWNRTDKAIGDIVRSMDQDGEIPDVDLAQLRKDVLNEALGLGPLEEFLGDDDVSEIMVNSANQIYVERGGRLSLANKSFSSSQAVLSVIERIVAPVGRRIDESSPLVDARLKDGSRVNAIIPPLALKGPCLTIRKFKREALKIADLIRYQTITKPMAEFLECCIKARKNIVISGGTGSGKTTTLNVISSFIPDTERIITVEDAAELQLPQEHWVQLETRPPNLEGKGQITIRDLVRNCLRMRPDRIVVGECRGGEALDMLQAMNTGHDGSLTTLHANAPRDCLARLETMVLMSGMELPIRAIREQIASAVDIVVQQTRFSDGSRRITHISEVSGMETDVITLQDIFYFKQEGFDERGRVQGRFMATGFVPTFYDDLQRRGIPVNMEIFREE